MTLTAHIKHARINVATGESDHEYYTETEWAGVLADRAAAAVTNARSAKKQALSAQVQAMIDSVVPQGDIRELQFRAMELLDEKLDGVITAEGLTELQSLKDKRAAAQVLRTSEATALAACDAATDLDAIEAVTI